MCIRDRVKPFEVEELIARVEAVLRRTGRGGQTLTAFDVTLDRCV